MKPGIAVLVVAIVFLVATPLQMAFIPSVQVAGARPDLLLAVCTPLALFLRPAGGAAVGFTSGLLQGALAGANLTHYVISRSITSFVTSILTSHQIHVGTLVAGLLTVLATLVSRMILMFLTAPPQIGTYLSDTIGSAVYNGVIALPLYALLRLFFKPSSIDLR